MFELYSNNTMISKTWNIVYNNPILYACSQNQNVYLLKQVTAMITVSGSFNTPQTAFATRVWFCLFMNLHVIFAKETAYI